MTLECLDILIVEDSPSDLFLVRQAIAHSGLHASLNVLDDGGKAVRFIEQAEEDERIPRPGLILLDLNLPKYNGEEILQRLRSSPRWGSVPVVIVSSCQAQVDSLRHRAVPSTSYFWKPSDYDQFMLLGGIIKDTLAESEQRLPRA